MPSSRQDESLFRRGLVMGLTMAEVMILVLFALLLLIGYQRGLTTVSEGAALRLEEVETAAGVGSSKIPDNFRRLVAAARAGGRMMAQANQADPLTEDPERLADDTALGRRVRQELGGNAIGQDGGEAAREFVAAAASAYGEQRQRFGSATIWIGAAKGALKESLGNGLVYPPCVAEPDGKPEYLFTAALFDQHIVLSDRSRGGLERLGVVELARGVRRGEPLDTATFVAQTRPLFEWSDRNGCRFFVWIEDSTGPAEKRLYKVRLRTVGQHFYYFEPDESVQGRR